MPDHEVKDLETELHLGTTQGMVSQEVALCHSYIICVGTRGLRGPSNSKVTFASPDKHSFGIPGLGAEGAS